MAGTVFTISRAAALAGTSPGVVEDFLKAMPSAAVKAQGQRVVTESGLILLRAYVKGIKEERSAPGSASADRGSGAGKEDPGTWSDAEIQARAKKISDELKGAGPDSSFAIHETVTIRDGR